MAERARGDDIVQQARHSIGVVRKERPAYAGLVRSLEAFGVRQWGLRLAVVDLVVLPLVCVISSVALLVLGFKPLAITMLCAQIGQTVLKSILGRGVVAGGGVLDACAEVLDDDGVQSIIRSRRLVGLVLAVLVVLGFGTLGWSRWGTLGFGERWIVVVAGATLAGYQYANAAIWSSVVGVVSAGLVAYVDAVRRDFEEKLETQELYASYARAHRVCLRASEDFAAFFVVAAEFVLVLLFILGIFATLQQAASFFFESRAVFLASSTCVVFGLGIHVFCNVVEVTIAGERVIEAANRMVVRIATGGHEEDLAPFMHLRQLVDACPLCFAPCGFKVEVEAGISCLYFLLSIATTAFVYVLGF